MLSPHPPAERAPGTGTGTTLLSARLLLDKEGAPTGAGAVVARPNPVRLQSKRSILHDSDDDSGHSSDGGPQKPAGRPFQGRTGSATSSVGRTGFAASSVERSRRSSRSPDAAAPASDGAGQPHQRVRPARAKTQEHVQREQYPEQLASVVGASLLPDVSAGSMPEPSLHCRGSGLPPKVLEMENDALRAKIASFEQQHRFMMSALDREYHLKVKEQERQRIVLRAELDDVLKQLRFKQFECEDKLKEAAARCKFSRVLYSDFYVVILLGH
jgi:hypothetical protein